MKKVISKIKDFFRGMFNDVVNVLKIYPITIVAVFIYTLIAVFGFEEMEYELIEKINFIFIFSVSGIFFSENVFFENPFKNIKKYIGSVVSVILAFVFYNLIDKNEENITILRWVIEYIALLWMAIGYLLCKGKEKIEKYILNVYINIKRYSFVYIVIVIGSLFIFGMINILELIDLDYDVYFKFLGLLLGFYYIPVVIGALKSEDAEDTKLSKLLISKVLLTLLAIAMVIVYIYLIKIIVTFTMPKNILFAMLTGVFCVMCAIYIFNKNYYKDENGNTYKALNILPLAFIPFLLVQAYSIGIRIFDHGFTEMRYQGVLWLVVEAIMIFLMVYKDSKKLNNMWMIVAILLTIDLISPLNFEQIAVLSQMKVLKEFSALNVDFETLSKADKVKYSSAYDTVSSYNRDVSFLDKDTILKMENYNPYYWAYNDEDDKDHYLRSIYMYSNMENIDLTNYKKMSEVSYYEYQKDEVDLTNIELKYYRGGAKELTYLDITDFVGKIVEVVKTEGKNFDQKSEEYLKDNNYISAGIDKDVYLTRLNLEIDMVTGEVNSINIDGYVLEKIK